MFELPVEQILRIQTRLRPDQLELVAASLDHIRTGLGADTDPVNAGRRGDRAVGLYGDLEAAGVERLDQRRIELEKRLPASDDDQAMRRAAPEGFDPCRQGIGFVAASVHPIHADEISVAEIA